MDNYPLAWIIGVSVGVFIGLLLAALAVFCFCLQKRHARVGITASRRGSTIPIRANGVDTCTIMSDSTMGQDSPRHPDVHSWFDSPKNRNLITMSGVPNYSYRDVQKATHNFTTLIGQGAFGPVYKANMPTGEVVAVKKLASNSRQGEKEFLNEVVLLGRLHHRNLVNLVGYCIEKNQYMLIYVFMINGSLASHLYGEGHEHLSWQLRINIAQDVARGLEYLHDGAVPPVLHRDIKAANILLDRSMRARVADFGLSREEAVNNQGSNIRGTFGYLDPEYVSTKTYTKRSDVYSFGVLLFELITGKNPNQGLIELIELAAMTAEGRVGWDEIADSRLDGKYEAYELNSMAALAYKCMNRTSRKRPTMREIVQALSRISMSTYNKSHRRGLSASADETVIDMKSLGSQTPETELYREESLDSKLDPIDA